jgi:hypothetical protein
MEKMPIKLRHNDEGTSEAYLQRGVSWQWVGMTFAGLIIAFLLGASDKIWNIGTNVPSRTEINANVEKHDKLDDQRFRAIEVRQDVFDRIQRERLDQINAVKDLTNAVEKHVLVLEKEIDIARLEFRMRMDGLETLIRSHVKEH